MQSDAEQEPSANTCVEAEQQPSDGLLVEQPCRAKLPSEKACLEAEQCCPALRDNVGHVFYYSCLLRSNTSWVVCNPKVSLFW